MAESLAIQVDDTDPGISYSGDWIADKGTLDNLGQFGAPMMSTSHYIKGKGSFSYSFSGTYVGVFGSSVDGSNPSRVCTVDGATIPNNVITGPVNGILDCQVYNLVDGEHTLEVNVPTPNPNGYWFDSLMYIPSASVSRLNAMLMVRFDDPSFSFGSRWSQIGPGMLTTTNGASMSFHFTGRVATWMGYYQDGETSFATTATYTIDGGSPMSFDLKAIPTELLGSGDDNERFFTTGLLSQGPHTLEVTYNGNSGTTALAIYSFTVQSGTSADMSIGGAIGASHPVQVVINSNGGGPPVTVTSTIPGAPVQSIQPPSVVIAGTGSSAVTITLAGTNSNSTVNPAILSSSTGSSLGSPTLTGPTGAPINSDNSSSNTGIPSISSSGSALNKSHSHLGAILGAVIGVLALLLFFLTFLFCRHIRKRREHDKTDAGVEPFTIPPRMSEISAAVDSSNSSGQKFIPFSNNQFYSDIKQSLRSNAATSATGLSATSPSQQSREGPSGPTSQSSRSPEPISSSRRAAESEVVVLHEDSGVRIPMGVAARPGVVTVVEMPPTYSAE